MENKPNGSKNKGRTGKNQGDSNEKQMHNIPEKSTSIQFPKSPLSNSSGLFAAEDKGSIPSCRLESAAWSQLASHPPQERSQRPWQSLPSKDLSMPKDGSEEAREGNATGSRNPEPVNFKTISLSEWHHQSCGPSWRACLPPCRCIGGWPAHDCSEWTAKSIVPLDHGHWNERHGSWPQGGPSPIAHPEALACSTRCGL